MPRPSAATLSRRAPWSMRRHRLQRHDNNDSLFKKQRVAATLAIEGSPAEDIANAETDIRGQRVTLPESIPPGVCVVRNAAGHIVATIDPVTRKRVPV